MAIKIGTVFALILSGIISCFIFVRHKLAVLWPIAYCLKINEHTLSNEAVSGSEQPAACVK